MTKFHTKNMQQMLNVEDLPRNGFTLNLAANDDEKKEIAKQLNLVAVHDFAAQIIVRPWRKNGLQIEGNYQVELSQNCVITLEDFKQKVSHDINHQFYAEIQGIDAEEGNEIEISEDDFDPPEALRDGVLNVQDYLSETLALELDPYPQKEGANLDEIAKVAGFELNQPTFEDDEAIEEGGEKKAKKAATHNPFANLDQMLKKK